MGQFLYHAACPNCGSADNLAVYDDNSHCFGCGYHINEGGDEKTTTRTTRGRSMSLLTGEFKALTKRGLSEETCRKFGYRVAEHNGEKVQVADYYTNGELVAQHIRTADKKFSWMGDAKGVELFGQHLWSAGKMVVVTEGELDAMSVSQIQGNKWPVVSLPNGAQSAKKYIQKNLEWLEYFETVILMFDNDQPGRDAVAECAPLFTPGRCKAAALPLKDANDMLMTGRGAEVIQAIWNAKPFRPDGIVNAADTWELVASDDASAKGHYPWPAVDGFLSGLRMGELVTVTAGSGIGKSLFCREVAKSLLAAGETVGYIALEENVKRTVLGFMGMELNKPLHISKEGVTEDELKDAFNKTAGSGRLFLYDHFGSTDSDNLIAKLRYLAKGCGCNWLVLDHISIVVSGIGDGDERRLIDNTMTKLRQLVEETGVGLLLVSHLKRPEGNKGHEDGLQTSLAHLRGSAAIAQLSDIVIGLERNQQSDNSDTTTVRVLKNRYTGVTGVAGSLSYSRGTGRLLAGEADDFDEEVSADEAAAMF